MKTRREWCEASGCVETEEVRAPTEVVNGVVTGGELLYVRLWSNRRPDREVLIDADEWDAFTRGVAERRRELANADDPAFADQS